MEVYWAGVIPGESVGGTISELISAKDLPLKEAKKCASVSDTDLV